MGNKLTLSHLFIQEKFSLESSLLLKMGFDGLHTKHTQYMKGNVQHPGKSNITMNYASQPCNSIVSYDFATIGTSKATCPRIYCT